MGCLRSYGLTITMSMYLPFSIDVCNGHGISILIVDYFIFTSYLCNLIS